MKELDLRTVIDTVALLKKANCESWVLLSELAKELKVNKTTLMRFIEVNSAHFVTGAPSLKAYKMKNPGLVIFDVFRNLEDNYTRPEFLRKQQEKYKDTLWVSEYGAYGRVDGYYVAEDMNRNKDDSGKIQDWEDHRKNRHLWRNTADKMKRLEASGHYRKSHFFDLTEGRTPVRFDHVVTKEDMQALRDEGWTIMLPDKNN